MNEKKKDKSKGRWKKRVISILASVVVFAATYALVLPAVTMDQSIAENSPGIDLGGGNYEINTNTETTPAEDVSQDLMVSETNAAADGEAIRMEGNTGSEDGTGAVIEAGSVKAETGTDTEKTDDTASAGKEDAAETDAAAQGEESAEQGAEKTDGEKDAEAAEGEKKDEKGAEAENPMPAQSFEEKLYDDPKDYPKNPSMIVSVEAEEGAFPKGTTMRAEYTDEKKVIDSITDEVKDGTRWTIASMRAVDITFTDEDGFEIEPLIPIRVTFTDNDLEPTKKDKDLAATLIHVDQQGDTSVVDPTDDRLLESKPEDNQVVFDADAFSVYAIVYTVNFSIDADGVQRTWNLAGKKSILLTDLIEALSDEEKDDIAKFVKEDVKDVTTSGNDFITITEKDDDYKIAFDFSEDRDFSGSGAELVLVLSNDMELSIHILVDGKKEVEAGAAVISSADGGYLPDEATGYGELLSEKKSSEAISAVEEYTDSAESKEDADQEDAKEKTVAYQVYDIGLENVDENAYEKGFKVDVTLPDGVIGTDFRLFHVHDGEVEELTVSVESSKNADGQEQADSMTFITEGFSQFVLTYTVDFHNEADGKTYNYSINGGDTVSFRRLVEVLHILEEDADIDSFIESIESIEFSDESLVKVARITEDTTAGELKEALGVTPEYSAELTEEQIAAMDAKILTAPDWALISLAPFDTNETLTITLEDGSVITIRVTDAQLKKTVITASGEAYEITVIYDRSAKIPSGAELEVSEILPAEEEEEETSEYADYVAKTEDALGWESGSASYIRLFDIKIVDKNGDKVEIAAPVDVTIELADKATGKEAEDNTQVVHFADGAKTGDVVNDVDVDGETVSFQADGFSVYAVVAVDPGELAGKSFGLINTKDGSKPSGIAMMSNAKDKDTKLEGKGTTVRVNTVNRTDYVYIANNSNITMWTFQEAQNGKFYITAKVGNAFKYLRVDTEKVTLADNSDEYCLFTVTEGSGANTGKYKLSTNGGVLRLNGSNFARAAENFNTADAWMNFAALSDLNEDDFVPYTAQKASISETAKEVNDGDLVVLYTRIWNDLNNKYDYYAIDYDGKLVRAYESGDTVSWVGSQINTMLWEFTEYCFEGSNTPNGYYELKNTYSDKYIAPRTSNGRESFLSDGTIGINLNGRGNGEYYTTILAWDDYYYASLKVDEDNIKLLSSTMAQASDFYFAKMSTETATMDVTTVSTMDNNQYGITLKMQDFGENENLSGGRSAKMTSILGNTPYEQWTGTKNLLKSYIEAGSGYPVATNSNKTLDNLFDASVEVNQQFLTSTYYETGYFEYDSTQNFAHLITSEEDPWYGLKSPNGGNYKVGDFVIYGQLGTSSEGGKDTLRHGQFLPFNDLIEGFKTNADGSLVLDEDGNPIPIAIKISNQYQNTMDIHAQPLSTLDPSYGEELYEIKWDKTHESPKVDHFFGMEMSASFMQSANGLDAWGHDLIFEFSGDDDFWLYVDDVLVLDLGGIHSALDGNINFRTGEIVENGKNYTLRQRFETAYRAQHTGATDADVEAWLNGIFKTDEQGQPTSVFKDYSSHTMRMFYLERGAGASNLHMRFNLSEYKAGRVQLEKTVSGTEKSSDSFPFQIWYEDPHTHVMTLATNALNIRDAKTEEAVPYQEEYSIQAGDNELTYESVFFLKAGQTVNIDLPDEDTKYFIKECAMDSPATYDWVKINGTETEGTAVAPQKYNGSTVTEETVISESSRLDFDSTVASVSARKKVVYENHLNENAKNSLTITKKIWQDEDRTKPIHSGSGENADNTGFQFRVYIGEKNGTYTLYKNGPYRVKTPEGYYCYYYHGDFVSTGKTDFDEITDDIVNNNPDILLGDTLQQRCTFYTGRGSISQIKADYIVEIPDLMNGTPFIVVERDNEIPAGYNRLGYTLNYSALNSDTVMTEQTEDSETSSLIAGTIQGSQSVTVHNQHGYTLTVNKVWSDAAFMENHDHIYFAVYLKGEGGTSTLVPNSVRQLGRTSTSLNWFFPELAEGKNLNDYEVYEVALTVPEGGALTVDSSRRVSGYTDITKIEEGGTLIAGGKSNEHGYSASMEYTASYSREVLTVGTNGKYPNTRTDTVYNSRAGLKIVKTDTKDKALEGAVFTLSKKGEADPTKIKRFVSDETGLIAVAYLKPDTEYTLTETFAPCGYEALIHQLTIRVNEQGKVFIDNSETNPENGYYTVTQVENPTAANMPVVSIRNQDYTLKAVKIDSYTGNPMQGVTFALYKEVYVSTNGIPDPTRPRPDYTPMEGYESLVTKADGTIPGIVLKNSANPNGLTAGNYYLREVETPAGYIAMDSDIRISISSTGQVTLESAVRPTQSGKDWTIGTVSSNVAEIGQNSDGSLQITVKNTPKDPVRIRKLDMGTGNTPLAGVKFELYKSGQIDSASGLPAEGETPVFTGTTDENGILNLGGLEGLYFLYETETLPGYILLSGPVQIVTYENSVMASLNSATLNCKKVKDGNGKDVWEITVYNSSGYELPSTGGPGTTLLTVLGGVLIALAGVLLVIRQKRLQEKG